MQTHSPLALHMDGNHVHARLHEAGQIVVRRINHEVCIQISIGGNGGADGGADIRAEGNVVHKGTIHHIQVQPVGAGLQSAVGFFSDAAEITGKH